MSAGYRGYEAFWIGGVSASSVVIVQPQQPEDTGGGSIIARPRRGPRVRSDFIALLVERQAMAELIKREDEELIDMMLAMLC